MVVATLCDPGNYAATRGQYQSKYRRLLQVDWWKSEVRTSDPHLYQGNNDQTSNRTTRRALSWVSSSKRLWRFRNISWGEIASTHHGRWNRYVDMRNRTMKAGEADVGMNKSGNQLQWQNHMVNRCLLHFNPIWGTPYLRRQNIEKLWFSENRCIQKSQFLSFTPPPRNCASCRCWDQCNGKRWRITKPGWTMLWEKRWGIVWLRCVWMVNWREGMKILKGREGGEIWRECNSGIRK